MRWQVKHLPPCQRNDTAVKDIKPTQHVEDGGFARSVGPDEAGDLPGAWREAHLSDSPHTAEGQ
jgi:hypothetical protein